MEILVSLHSLWRYAVLVVAVVALVVAIGAWLGSLSLPLSPRLAGVIYVGVLDIQLLLGILLWLAEARWNVPGFFRFEHPTIMILAVVVAHAGQAMAKKRPADPKAGARTLAIAIAVSLLLVVVGIPGVVRGP